MSNPKWQNYSWARRRLWALVVSKFTDARVAGPETITLTRRELVEHGVFGDFDSSGKPLPPGPKTFMDEVDAVRRENGSLRAPGGGKRDE